ncbi:hypothetical protein JW877_09260 [bacterium]|nr:hypothetical protein [bacterium]
MIGNIGVLDIGTNSMLLLIASFQEGEIQPVLESIFEPRLGESLHSTGRISPEAFSRGLKYLGEISAVFKKYNVYEPLYLGTRVFREAQNRESFLRAAKENLNIKITVLKEKEEANLIFRSACQEFKQASRSLIIDVGGGSTEIISGDSTNTDYLRSLPLGAVTMKDQFQPSYPLSISILNEFRADIKSRLSNSGCPANYPNIIGSGGTITTLGALKLGLDRYQSEKIHGSILKIEYLTSVIDLLSRYSIDRIRSLIIDHDRADIFIPGLLIWEGLVATTGANTILINNRGLRWGALWDVIHKNFLDNNHFT